MEFQVLKEKVQKPRWTHFKKMDGELFKSGLIFSLPCLSF